MARRLDASWASFRARMLEHPFLSEQETRMLIKKFQETGDVKYSHRILKHNMRFVFAVARHFAQPHEPVIWEYFDEGCAGLLHAVGAFNLKKKLKFMSYAVWWVRQRILRYRETDSLLPLPAETRRKLKRAAFDTLPDDAPERKSVKRHGMVAFKYVSEQHVTSLDAKTYKQGSSDSDTTYIESLDAGEGAIPNTGRVQLHKLLESLPDGERDTVKRYFGIGMAEPDTLDVIGKAHNRSKERVRQLKNKALERMRERAAKMRLKFNELDLEMEASS